MKANKIKIAYILTPITFGGAEKVSLNFLRSVDNDRFDIRPILLIRPWEDMPYFVREIYPLGYSYETVPVALRPLSKGRDRFRLVRVAYRLYSILKSESFDVVHSHGYFADICGLPIARMLGIRTISTCHGFIDTDTNLRIYNKVDTFALRLAKYIIAVSEGIKSDLVQRGINESKIATIPNAVSLFFDEDEILSFRTEKRCFLGFDSEDFVVGYVGRLSKEKGLNYLIQAVAELLDAGMPVKLLIVGDGPERQALEQMVNDKGLDSIVIFVGFQTDIENWLPALDVFTLPSLTEGTPMALLEAMAMKAPVIATEVGGVPKVIKNGINGLLVKPGSSYAISKCIQDIKTNPNLKARLGRAGSEIIKSEYNVNNWCRKIEENYTRLLKG